MEKPSEPRNGGGAVEVGVQRGRVRAPSGLRLRKGASVSEEALTTLPEGAALDVIERDGGWLRVRFEDYEGYVAAQFVDLDRSDGFAEETSQADPGLLRRGKRFDQRHRIAPLLTSLAAFAARRRRALIVGALLVLAVPAILAAALFGLAQLSLHTTELPTREHVGPLDVAVVGGDLRFARAAGSAATYQSTFERADVRGHAAPVIGLHIPQHGRHLYTAAVDGSVHRTPLDGLGWREAELLQRVAGKLRDLVWTPVLDPAADWALAVVAQQVRLDVPEHLRGRRGRIFRDILTRPDCPLGVKGPELVEISAGAFFMGAVPGDPAATADEKPRRFVVMQERFAIGRTEVTNAQWNLCVDGGGCPSATAFEEDAKGGFAGSSTFEGPGFAAGASAGVSVAQQAAPPETLSANESSIANNSDLPVGGLTWEQARTYARWLTRCTGYTYELPTEAQWEYAARGGTQEIHLPGSHPAEAAPGGSASAAIGPAEVGLVQASLARLGYAPGMAVDGILGPQTRWAIESFEAANGMPRTGQVTPELLGMLRAGPAPAMSGRPNPFSLFGIDGNVAEWVTSCTFAQTTAGTVCTLGSPAGDTRIVRGGGEGSTATDRRLSARRQLPSSAQDASIGFRVLRRIRLE